MNLATDFVNRLECCPAGQKGWRTFEDLCVDILIHLFVPPLSAPRVQSSSTSCTDRRDAIFPNRNLSDITPWGFLFHDLKARMILFDFKNYHSKEIGKDQVDQIAAYMREPWGQLALAVCSKEPSPSARVRQRALLDRKGTVIVLLTKEQLKEMLYIKERGDDPARLILDLIEDLYCSSD